VSLSKTDNGSLTARQAGSIGGRMVKKIVDDFKSK
jgi:hypothetical protein